jgi:hypothetical protein
LAVFVANHRIWAFRQTLEFWKICIHHYELGSFPVLKSFSRRLVGYKQICQHLKDLSNSVNQIFSNDQCMGLQNHARVKDPF